MGFMGVSTVYRLQILAQGILGVYRAWQKVMGQ